jgi:hypothetical protein
MSLTAPAERWMDHDGLAITITITITITIVHVQTAS